MIKQQPCKDCTIRAPACHMKCEKYLEWKKWYESMKEKMRKDNEIGAFYRQHDNRYTKQAKRHKK